MNKRVMFAIPNLGKGGAEAVVTKLANKFHEEGFIVQIILLDNFLIENEICKDISIKFIEYDKNKHKLMRFIERIRKIRKELKDNQVDCVFSFLTSSNILLAFAGIFLKTRIILSERSDPYQNVTSKMGKLLRRFAYSFADGFVFQTEDAKKYFSKRIQKKSVVIYNPIKSNIPQKQLNEWNYEIIAASRLEKGKNIEMLISAFDKFYEYHKDYTLKIYGDGSEKSNLISFAKEKKSHSHIQFMGMDYHWQEKVTGAAMFINTSNYEGMSNSVMEAMGMGLPVIATDLKNGSNRILIKNYKNGILIPIGDIEALYKSMCKLADDQPFAESISTSALSINERFNIDKIYMQWVKLVERSV